MLKKILLAFSILLLPTAANAQVRQSGTVTPRHAACWTTTGVVQDCGTAVLPFANTLGLVGQGPQLCVYSSDPTTSSQRLCLSANANSNSEISLQNLGGSTSRTLQFNVNGTIVPLPASGQSYIFSLAPFTSGGVPCWADSSGTLLTDCSSRTGSGPLVFANGPTLSAPQITSPSITGGLITSAAITGVATPINPTDAVPKSYADAAAAGLVVHTPVRLTTAAVLPNTPTYANGAAGVGATLTAGSNAALSVDGVLTVVGNRVLIKNQVSTTGCTVANAGCQNGVYTVTAVGSGAAVYVLTRATDFDTAAEMLSNAYFLTTAGVTNAGASYTLQTAVTTVGTDPLTFNQFGSANVSSVGGMQGAILCGSGIVCGSSTIGLGPGFINVQNATYGALGDGATDDTVAIQAACTAATNGGTIYFPQGTYIISNTITCNSANLNLLGDGQVATTIKNKNSSAIVSMFTMGGAFQTVKNLTLDGNRTNGGGAALNINDAGITALGPNFVLDNAEIKNVNFQGIIFGTSANNLLVSNNYIHDNGDSGDINGAAVKMIGAPVGGMVRDNIMVTNYGLTVPGPSGPNIGGGAIALAGTQMIVTGNYMANNYNFGGQIAEQNSAGVQGVVRNWTISNNTFLITSEPATAATYAIEISGQVYAITGNMIDGGKGGCVSFETAPTFTTGTATVDGNICVNTSNGVVLTEFGGNGVINHIAISNNVFKGQTTGVNISAHASQIGIVGNNFFGVATPIVNAAGANEVTVSGNLPVSVGIPWPVANVTATAPGGGGGFTASSTVAYLLDNNKRVTIRLNVAISANGAGAPTNVTVSGLPFTVNGTCVLAGRANAVSGSMIQGVVAGSGATLLTYNSSYPGATGENLLLTGSCEVL